ncbi:RNA polymerase factor sigma-54 [Sphingomonas sp. NSE70-1]|uniref:RNA polymerase sigma-54 factor n=1 Tax=Sphingomonas caseinilyticus TaxID=2908205 RepID=A0ABT0RVA1_9SPHN|nr:RNA polymerase factor sigma-54 [Sphingomonas caseinilyticus]MCL6698768.1 RNA polymerase factor sigma-54 [Sphingomonas caseinilyticus]
MGLGPRIDLRVSQQLVMTQQLQQAIKLLALSNLEIEAVIAEELAKNPLLEARPGEGAAGEAVIVRQDSEFGDEATDPTGSDELIAKLGGADDSPVDMDWREAALEVDSFVDVGSGLGSEDAFDFDRLEGGETGLAEHLLAQLQGTGGTIGRIAEAIVHELEETGYLETQLRLIAEECEARLEEAEQALELVQSLDPPGVAARSLEECIALQAKAADRYDPAMARLIANLDLLAKGRMADLRRICGVDEEDLADMVRELRAYDPKPGCRFVTKEPEAITPDVFVRKSRGGWLVELNTAALPKVLVNRRYYAELKAGPQDKKSKAWLTECMAEANWLVKALDQRARTIVKVATEIVKQQQGFFEQGVSALKPLTLAKVAEAIEMHESTVSRVTSNKYLACDRGMLELKYFFGSGVASEGGEGAAAEAVKAAIKALIDSESDILSDDAIAGMLKDRGMDVARRTVVKYREAMGIGSSIQRRRQRKMVAG